MPRGCSRCSRIAAEAGPATNSMFMEQPAPMSTSNQISGLIGERLVEGRWLKTLVEESLLVRDLVVELVRGSLLVRRWERRRFQTNIVQEGLLVRNLLLEGVRPARRISAGDALPSSYWCCPPTW